MADRSVTRGSGFSGASLSHGSLRGMMGAAEATRAKAEEGGKRVRRAGEARDQLSVARARNDVRKRDPAPRSPCAGRALQV